MYPCGMLLILALSRQKFTPDCSCGLKVQFCSVKLAHGNQGKLIIDFSYLPAFPHCHYPPPSTDSIALLYQLLKTESIAGNTDGVGTVSIRYVTKWMKGDYITGQLSRINNWIPAYMLLNIWFIQTIFGRVAVGRGLSKIARREVCE